MGIYLDNMAATPIDHRVAEHHHAIMLTIGANAHSSEHADGVAAQEMLDKASSELSACLETISSDVLFTPGASPALWLAIEDCIGRIHGRLPIVAASAAEHPSLLGALRQADRDDRIRLVILGVDHNGLVRIEEVHHALEKGVDLLCVMAANNEVGAITEIDAIIEAARSKGVRTLVDASQAAGKTGLGAALGADLLVISGAKIYGPRRSGAIIGEICKTARDRAEILFGSPDVASASALAFAMGLQVSERDNDNDRIAAMRDKLQAQLVDQVDGLVVNAGDARRLAGALHVSTPHLPGDAVTAKLWGQVAISTGAACQSGVPGPSHVLTAMGLEDWICDGAIRIGIGRFNTGDEIELAGSMIAAALGPVTTARKFA